MHNFINYWWSYYSSIKLYGLDNIKGAVALAIYRCYTTAKLVVISEFLEALSLNVKVLNTKREYQELLKTRCEIEKIDSDIKKNEEDNNKDAEIEALKEKLKAISDLVLSVV